jgi:hypothetical protein
MEIRLHHILILACIASAACVTSSYGQDSGIPDYEMTDNEREKMLYSPGGEGEVRPRYPAAVPAAPKDSASITRITPVLVPPSRLKPEQPLKPSEKQPPPKHDDDSILSFNFLYYIIQKYKLQDIID